MENNKNDKLETISNLFEGNEIRSIWDADKEEYYFSVVDVIGALTNNDYQKSRNYWKWLKNKLIQEGSELVSDTNQLKMKAKDGKFRETDTLDTKGILRLIESIPSSKAEPFKLWLAQMGKERIDDLEFQGLKIIQNKNWFKFGIDSVLISDFAKDMKKNGVVLDIGTGTGVIAILLSKKIESKKIFGIEIQSEVADMARRSVELNGIEDKVEIINDNVKNIEKYFENNSVDCIVTNPPYQKANTGLENEDENKLISRHEIKCTLEDILQKSYKILKDKGEFYMVHRTERLVDVLCAMRENKIEPKEIKFVYSKVSEKPNLFLVKGIKNAKSFLKVLEPLIVYNNDGSYTDEILKIYGKEK